MKNVQKTATASVKDALLNPFFYFLVMATGFLFTACEKSNVTKPENEVSLTANSKANTDEAFLNNYGELPFKTLWELQQARAASAKYQRVENALADGYVDIAVDVEHMGHHYMNTNLLDATFDIRHPEILVYNKDENGKQQLVAVEYAIPLNNPMPEGFTGSADVWDGNTGFGLWLLHAWVWYKNPDGVFKPFNPLVELH